MKLEGHRMIRGQRGMASEENSDVEDQTSSRAHARAQRVPAREQRVREHTDHISSELRPPPGTALPVTPGVEHRGSTRQRGRIELRAEGGYVPPRPPATVSAGDRLEWLRHTARRDAASWVDALDHLELDLTVVKRYAPMALPSFLAVVHRLEQELASCAEYIVTELDPRFRVRGDDLAAGLARFERTGAPEIDARTQTPEEISGHVALQAWAPSASAKRIKDETARREAELYSAKRDGRDLLRALDRFEKTNRLAEARAPELLPPVRELIDHLEAQLESCERFIRARSGDEAFRIVRLATSPDIASGLLRRARTGRFEPR